MPSLYAWRGGEKVYVADDGGNTTGIEARKYVDVVFLPPNLTGLMIPEMGPPMLPAR